MTILQKVSVVNSRGMSATFSGDVKPLRRHFTQKRLQPFEAGRGYHACLFELGLGEVAARFLDDLAARDLHFERALQPEDDVQEVNGLGAQIINERGVQLTFSISQGRAAAMISAIFG